MWTAPVIIVAAILGLGPLAADPALAQQVPAAIVADPPADKEFPAALAVVSFPSHGVDLDATLYLASGRGPHGAVVLLHGLPGYEVNGDLSRFLVNSVCRRRESRSCASGYGPVARWR